MPSRSLRLGVGRLARRVSTSSSNIARIGLTPAQERQRRAFDLVVAGVGVVVSAPVSILGVLAATIDTGEWGVFSQVRVGKDGWPIQVHKIRTMRTSITETTTVTTGEDPRITRVGRQLRRFKIDELPQLVDVLLGRMSIVGPRPDVPGWADRLEGEDRIVVSVRPGITGPASLAFRDEEDLLASAPDPEAYNRTEIWPEKVRINTEYVQNWSLGTDLRCVARTVLVAIPRTSG